ncbi:3-oxoacyl-[acyl-carrier-protein] reductase Oar2 [Schizosaccharomyces japonicus yFS275]|uniref:3-oxoacyl-[acyl-carrier-protein] reductase Oar2 n=1 Tax=Schizosaccharomyces japonicus (strain yFS275 / FY16936) TaxID=402676 RepID=B6K3K8_SCHJY|nr:3-oxoacyl-[acyl-carrier-protein] reductase Oar2 [Schizosaccharomyces japonicus yFS275]EEB08065.1 3-oxoacyl-[acyl-carrier-protein] reductase Oar2 [Schizosaccharomyces japonicus yFS275]
MKRILITGASSGLGKRMAECWSASGHEIHMVARNEKRLKQVFSQLDRSQNQQHSYTILDVATSPDGIQELVRQNLPTLDAAVHAAGVTQESLCIRTSRAEMQCILRTNLEAAIELSQAVCKQWLRRSTPSTNTTATRSLLFISSLLSTTPSMGTSIYAASKAALEGFTRTLALEMKSKNIRVNAIAPTYVDTPMLSERVRAQIKTERIASVDEVVRAATFLLFDSMCSGNIVPLH